MIKGIRRVITDIIEYPRSTGYDGEGRKKSTGRQMSKEILLAISLLILFGILVLLLHSGLCSTPESP